jgi:capsular exopolysaccharide synthesis family protein
LNSSLHQGQESDPFDLDKFFYIFRKSILYIIAFITIGVAVAYLVVRYTKPLYESEAIIKLNFESEANTLGLVANDPFQRDLNDISGEIELIKSKLFLNQVVENINYPVAYYAYGTYLTDERYSNNPFEVSFKVKNTAIYNQAIDVNLTNDKTYVLKYALGGEDIIEEYSFGEEISNQDFNLLIEKTDFFNQDVYGRYFFRINSFEALIAYFEQNLTIQPENFNAKTIKISLTDYNRYKARDFVNIISNLYLEYSTETKNQALKQKIEFLDRQIKSTESRISEFEEYFENFTIENKTVSLQQDLSRTIELLNALDSQQFRLQEHYSTAEVVKDRIQKEGDLRLNPFILELLPGYISEALEDYEKLVKERSLKLTAYNENTSVIRRIDDQLIKTRTDVLELMLQYSANLKDQIQEIKQRRNSLERNFVELPSMGTEYNKNRRLYEQREEFLLSLRRSKMELEITQAGTVTDFLILSSASLPSTPIKPQKLLILGVGLVGGLILSLFFVAIRYLLHNKITSVRELERLTSVPIIGSVPKYNRSKLPQTKLIIDQNARSLISEALRTIRTNMEFILPGKDTHLMTVTSTISGEGKTFVAVNLGAIIASGGQKVCIVDLDMRKPKVHLAFGVDASNHGVSTILIGRTTIEDSIRTSDIENLDYLGAGATPPNPSELILGDQFEKLLEQLKKKYDLVILDTPPVGLVTDGVLAMKKSDLQLYIMKSDYSKRAFVRTVQDLQRINHFPNMAILLNGTKNQSTGYSYSYGYGYGYGYGTGGGYYDEPKSNKMITFLRSLF